MFRKILSSVIEFIFIMFFIIGSIIAIFSGKIIMIGVGILYFVTTVFWFYKSFMASDKNKNN